MQSMGSFSGGSGSYDLSSTAADSSQGYVQGGNVKFGSRNINYGMSATQSYTGIIIVAGIGLLIGWYLLKKK